MLKLYFHHTPNPIKVALLLEEVGREYQIVPVDLFKGEQHQPAYRAINPNGKVPAIDAEGTVVFDSSAILLYLAEQAGQFLGTAHERPALLSWLMFVASGLGPFAGQAVHFTRVHAQSAYATHRYLRELERHFTVLDGRLERAPYLAGESYTIADMAAWAWIDWAHRNQLVLGEQHVWSKWPRLQRWFVALGERPAVERVRQRGKELQLKTVFDEETLRALFPQNFAATL